MPHKVFGTEHPRAREPITFELNGEQFEALAEAPAGVVNDLLAGISLDEKGNRVYSAPNLVRYVSGVLVEERAVPFEGDDAAQPRGSLGVLTVDEARERGLWVNPDWHAEKVLVVHADDVERFYSLVNSKTRVVSVDTLGGLVMWLSEQLSGRPTEPSGR